MKKELIQKVEIKDIPKGGLFIYRKEVWRSLGKLLSSSHSCTAQKVFVNKHDTEVYTANADFSDHFKVRPYVGKLPILKEK